MHVLPFVYIVGELSWVHTFTIVLPIAPEDRKIGSWQPITTIEGVMAEYRRGIFVTSGGLVRLTGTGPRLVARRQPGRPPSRALSCRQF